MDTMQDVAGTAMPSVRPSHVATVDRSIETIQQTNDRMIVKRRHNLRHYAKTALLVAGIELTLMTAFIMIGGVNGDSIWSILAVCLFMGALYPITKSVTMYHMSKEPPAAVLMDDDQSKAAWSNANHVLSLLATEPSDMPDPKLATAAQVLVDTLQTMTPCKVGSLGMYGYPPRHSTGDMGNNYDADPLDSHVTRVRRGLSHLMAVIACTEDVPSTQHEVNGMVGNVAAPLRWALKYHGIRIRSLDDGKTTPSFRRVQTFDQGEIVPVDPIDDIRKRMGDTENLKRLEKHRNRVVSMGLHVKGEDHVPEAGQVIDRYIPALSRRTRETLDAADDEGRDDVIAIADESIGIIADSLKRLADAHMALLRHRLDSERRFLTSREPRDPLSGDDGL